LCPSQSGFLLPQWLDILVLYHIQRIKSHYGKVLFHVSSCKSATITFEFCWISQSSLETFHRLWKLLEACACVRLGKLFYYAELGRNNRRFSKWSIRKQKVNFILSYIGTFIVQFMENQP
jgi:hypothetical protein